ncbi:N-acetylglucosaminyldiphosphoundecaprenol N-acetyl-beta-D-mannosaminyltransferase [Noviherbaspirillum humi]|uniref:N-acetylglucosaminyldiphosphoundecaprenol N-acetyl-beta-D-mannosaminyltransferase n=1 Tax=Noviherbaspirillum humi TaxID=1688639 RepID=A0A239GV25_9BURK|nr:WecB/TagA/CpsF family glycosyltransferase [Noviherbaspirillum humi]SNS73076.1 N-acetylglucosaminyldiphosphoundecaprenol N-acetyl-beta-D-mannosaminyltransferase [Noviherbaspirillum humi]
MYLDAPTTQKTDFFRPVYCILGLPLDAISLQQAVDKIRNAATTRNRCFLSTPNLNFVIGSRTDKNFRDSVIRSDLSLPDGMPLVWISKLMSVPIRERIAGSTLFESICKRNKDALSVYFFGGPDGAAGKAAELVNSASFGVKCVGHKSPGYGSMEEMSRREFIEDINTCGPDFLIIAMGAKKGQAWIERNYSLIQVPVISHLGAVVNMTAGRIYRAPEWLQRIGLEWLWRIKEEPVLWRRYFSDGLSFMNLMLTRVLPCLLVQRTRRVPLYLFDHAKVFLHKDDRQVQITFVGPWGEKNIGELRTKFTEATIEPSDITLDCHHLNYVDSALLGLFALLYGHQLKIGMKFHVVGVSPSVKKMFCLHCAEYLLS